jgi:dTDP-4-dehydrorhamnose reductase
MTLSRAALYLRGPPLQVYMDQHQSIVNLADLAKALKARFAPLNPLTVYTEHLINLKHGNGSVLDFSTHFRRIVRKLDGLC